MGEFSPGQLDLLEDALEQLSDEGALASLIADEPKVAARLAEYRALLREVNDALPDEDVPHELLASVHAQARASGSVPRESILAASSDAETRKLKSRGWRSLAAWVPGLAVVAALVLGLVLLRPRAPELPQVSEPTLAQLEPSPAPSPTPSKGAAAETESVLERAGAAKPAARGRPMVERSDDAEQGAEDEPELEPGAQLAAAHAQRRAGDCLSALASYRALTQAPSRQIAAQAHAGVGLCARLRGDEKLAQGEFKIARKLDPGVDAWLAEQREPPKRGKRPQTRSRKASKNAPKQAKPKARPSDVSAKQSAPNADVGQ